LGKAAALGVPSSDCVPAWSQPGINHTQQLVPHCPPALVKQLRLLRKPINTRRQPAWVEGDGWMDLEIVLYGGPLFTLKK